MLTTLKSPTQAGPALVPAAKDDGGPLEREQQQQQQQPNAVTSPTQSPPMALPEDGGSSNRIVLRKGYAKKLKKLKSMKTRYFVLWKDRGTNDVLLDYFDSQKKYEANPNRAISKKKPPIIVNQCFSISKRVVGTKNAHAIALFTPDDCFSMVWTEGDSEREMNEWLDTLMQHWHPSHSPNIEHVWQVEVQRKGALVLQNPQLLGRHRLCLTSSGLLMYRVDGSDSRLQSTPPLEFPLKSIRKCARTDQLFNLELGRSASIGQGDLLLQVEDSALAHHMHKAIHEAMKCSTNREEPHSMRPRSASTSDSSKALSSRRSTIGSITSATQSHLSSFTGTPAASTTLVSAHNSSVVSASLRDRSYSMSERQRPPMPPGGEHSTAVDDGYFNMETTTMSRSSSAGHSDLVLPTVKESPYKSSESTTTSAAGSKSSTPHDIMPLTSRSRAQTTRHETWPGAHPDRLLEEVDDEYIAMSPGAGSMENGGCGSSGSRRSSFLDRSMNYEDNDNSYLEMRPGGPDSFVPNSKSSAMLSSVEDEGYLDMTPLSSSLPKTSLLLGTSPRGGPNSPIYTQPLFHSYDHHTKRSPPRFTSDEFPLDKVKSYFSPSEESESFDLIRPARAYSIGSRPQLSAIRKKSASSRSTTVQQQQQHHQHTSTTPTTTTTTNGTAKSTSANSVFSLSNEYSN